ncbi:MAG TPA: glycosyltransferase family 4 protein [Candidatus Dormibacteraeota bacterium]
MSAAPRRIAVIAPPWYPVPPRGYGGIELVVGLLVTELRAQGHDVVLFAAEGSDLATHVCGPAHWGVDLGRPAERQREVAYSAQVLQRLEEIGPLDVIHDHCGGAMLMGAALLDLSPLVHTVHGAIREPEQTFYTSLPPSVGLLAISQAQRASAPWLPWRGTVHNAVDLSQLRVGEPGEREPYLLCLARVCPEKGQDLAIEVARRTGIRLVLAGKIESTPSSVEYFHRRVAPHIDGRSVVHIDNVAGAEKADLLARATALLAPLRWEEPFGLALVEAMASGTPAIAFARGAAPELIVPEVTGFTVGDVAEMVDAVGRVEGIDRLRCAAVTRERFGPLTMTRAYLTAYEAAIAAHPRAGELVLLSGKKEPWGATAYNGQSAGAALDVDAAGAVGEP